MFPNLGLIKLWRNPDFYLGQIPLALKVNSEEREIFRSFSLGDLSVGYKFFQFSSRTGVEMFHKYLKKWGILNFLNSLSPLEFEEICAELTKEFGFKVGDSKRRKMIDSLLNILVEIGIAQKIDGVFKFVNAMPKIKVPQQERDYAERNFTILKFFGLCLDGAFDFLKGKENMIDFSGKNAQAWDWILGSREMVFGRQITLKAMQVGAINKPKILDLCFGRGYSTIEILKEYPKAEVYAIDYIDDHISSAKQEIRTVEEKTGMGYSVNFISSEKWTANGKKGFGVPLPFENNSLDAVFSAANDGAIAPEIKRFVYKDIYRVLKPGGVFGALFSTYPDEERKIHYDKWERCQVYLHNFCESVVEGFYQFYDYEPTERMFRDIGFTSKGFATENLCLLRICWRMRK